MDRILVSEYVVGSLRLRIENLDIKLGICSPFMPPFLLLTLIFSPRKQ